MAMHHLQELMNIAEQENKTQAQADAALKLGLLNYQEGIIQKSVSYFQKHFELTRKDESATKSQRAIDSARVNLGIAQANTMMEACKNLVLTDVQALLEWKVKRNMPKAHK